MKKKAPKRRKSAATRKQDIPLLRRLGNLEKRVEEVATELGAVREQFLKAFARSLHGPSQPPPPPST